MTITLDKVSAEMLKAILKSRRQNDPKKFLTQLIQRMYMEL